MKLLETLVRYNSYILTEAIKKEYGCVMLSFDFPEIKDIHKIIDKDDIFSDPNYPSTGLEKDSHCTLVYGLHKEVTLYEIKEVLKDFKFKNIYAYNPSLFENENFDVLKFDVKGKSLNEINKTLKTFPHTSKFKDYHAHITIAYLKSGTGKKYLNMLEEKYKKGIKPQYVVYSEISGKKHKIPIQVEK